jgi:23S rRNA (uracil1939-C5)-methyltransferase
MTLNCRHHPRCPGCPLIEVPYEGQLERKRARLARALSRFPHLPEPGPIRGSAWTEGYRHRLKLPLYITRDRVSIGLYAGTRVLDTPDCPVLAEPLRAALPTILDWLRGRRGIHSLDLRVSGATGELQAVFACKGGEIDGGPKAIRDLMRQLPKLVSVATSLADPAGKRVMGSRPRTIAGSDTLEESIGRTRYGLLPGAFFQVDPRQAAVLHDLVKDAVGDARTVLDLYAGVGAYALMLAPGRQRVVMVEEVRQAAEAARARAPRNVEVLACRVEDAKLDGRFDVAVLNPARRGSDPESLARVARMAERLIYVSCGPETLARDLDTLASHGMRVRRITPIDLFPQTGEVETVVELGRGPSIRTWDVQGGRARGPWHGEPSGAVGTPSVVLALLLRKVTAGSVPGAKVSNLGEVATHSLVELKLDGPLPKVLGALGRMGHRVVGEDPKTRKFFAEKAGLVRPFVHVSRAGSAVAPLHGDLVLALEALGAPPGLVRRALSSGS